MLLLGTTDGYANIHAPNERVLLDEFERAVAAEADFLGRFAERLAGVVTSAAPRSRPGSVLERVLDESSGGNKCRTRRSCSSASASRDRALTGPRTGPTSGRRTRS